MYALLQDLPGRRFSRKVMQKAYTTIHPYTDPTHRKKGGSHWTLETGTRRGIQDRI